MGIYMHLMLNDAVGRMYIPIIKGTKTNSYFNIVVFFFMKIYIFIQVPFANEVIFRHENILFYPKFHL